MTGQRLILGDPQERRADHRISLFDSGIQPGAVPLNHLTSVTIRSNRIRIAQGRWAGDVRRMAAIVGFDVEDFVH